MFAGLPDVLKGPCISVVEGDGVVISEMGSFYLFILKFNLGSQWGLVVLWYLRLGGFGYKTRH